MFTMTSTANSLQAVTAQIIALLWIFLQGQAQAKIYTSCLGRRYGFYTTTNFCYDRSTTRCCYEKCCDAWDYSYSFTYSSCQSTFGYSYQTCKNGLSTNCCRKSYGGYSTCCYTSTNWWSTSSSSTNWWSSSSTTNFWDSGSSRGPSLGGIIGGVFGTIVIVIIIVVVSVICCGHRSAGRRGRVLQGAGNTNAMPIVMAGTQPTATTTVTHQSYPAQPPPGRYPNQYPQGPYPYPQGGPSYPQEPLQGSAPYPPSTGVYAPPPSYDSALNMQMGSTVPEHRVPNPSESVPSAPYPQGPVDVPYPTQPTGMPPPSPRY